MDKTIAASATITTATTTSSCDNQTHDFMNVDSFSQLPFIRPAPSTSTTNKSSSSGGAIRLFGIDFSSSTTPENSDSVDNNLKTTSNSNNSNNNNNDNNSNLENGESGRKFECHYCCRNFPTSQALGGHQNAHKRERQHAKRVHLQSAMLTSDSHLLYYPHHHRPTNSYYPTTTPSLSNINSRYPYHPTSGTTTTSFSQPHHHHHHHHHPPTINGSPLAMWRIPTAVHPHHHHGTGIHRDRSLMHPLPLFAGPSSSSVNIDNSSKINMSMNMSMSMNSSQNQVRRSGSDHVSLDLHL